MEDPQDESKKIHNSGDFRAGGNAYIGNSFKTDTIIFGQDGSLEQKRAAIARALAYQGIDTRRSSIAPATFRSFDWIWETEFSTWLTGDQDIFWITGKAGSGKSTLMKFLAESKWTRHSLNSGGRRWSILRFFFDFRFGTGIANTPEGTLQSMLLQMVRKSKDAVEILRALNASEEFQPDTLDELLKATVTILVSEPESHCIFIDGIDEYQGDLSELVTVLLRFVEQTMAKFVLASRPLAKIDAVLHGQPQLVMQDYNFKTLQAYLYSVNSQLELDLETSLPLAVLDTITQRANEVILWAKFAVENILISCGGYQDEEVGQLQRHVRDLPIFVDDMYESTLARIPPRLAAEAALYLHLIDQSQQRMTLVELRALAETMTVRDPTNFHVPQRLKLYYFTKRLLALFGGLLDIKEIDADLHIASMQRANSCWSAYNSPNLQDCIVLEARFVHETMKAYLDRTKWVRTKLQTLVQGYLDIFESGIFFSALHRECAVSTEWAGLDRFIQQWKTISLSNPGALTKLLGVQRDNSNTRSEHLFPIVASVKVLNMLWYPKQSSSDHFSIFQKALASPWMFVIAPLCRYLLPYHQLYEGDNADLFWAVMACADDYIFGRRRAKTPLDTKALLDVAITSITVITDTKAKLNCRIFDKIILKLVLQGVPLLDRHLVILMKAEWVYEHIDLVELRKISCF